ncbi:MAG TPA: hypothetical protein VE224_12420, partial [Pseudolabrys sp.]|nr:hypothetical protein [Pseudolabrys sp.]
MSDLSARGSHRLKKLRAEAIDPGHDLPLSVDGRPGRALDRHRISIQWLTGTILVGLSGAALMGGAVVASLDRGSPVIAPPEHVAHALRGSLGGGPAHRSDRLPIARTPAFVRQTVRLSTVRRVGDRELVRTGAFMRVGGKLSLAASGSIADLPPYNPQRLLASSAPGGKRPPKAAARFSSAVSFVMRDLSKVRKLNVSFVTPPAQVMARVREAAVWSRKTAGHPAGEPNITGIKLAYADEDSRDPFAGLEAKIVPENVTQEPKTNDTVTGGNPFKEHVVTARKGDNVAGILHDLGATGAEVKAILPLLGAYGGAHALDAGDKVDVLLNTMADGKTRPVRVMVADHDGPEAVAALSDKGVYVAVDPASVDDDWAESPADDDDAPKVASSLSLYQSIYATALRNHVPRHVIDDLIRIYAFDVDFDRHVRANDAFNILYGGPGDPAAGDRKEILYAALTVNGQTKRLYRFQSPDTGSIDYYDQDGKSARKFLLRKPVSSGDITSGFGWRRHPLLGYVAMHTGV